MVIIWSNQINDGKWMVPWRILLEDGNDNVDVAPQSIQLQFTSLHPLSPRREWNGMEWNGMEWNGMEWNYRTEVTIKHTHLQHLLTK